MAKKAKGKNLLDISEAKVEYKPLQVVMGSAGSSSTLTRRNAASTIERTDKYANIQNEGVIPFKSSSNKDYGSSLDIRDAVILCQKTYYNFSIFRNTIDLMTEFSTSSIFLKDGSKKSQDFFKGFLSKINILGLQDRFFREYYRSGNVFIYKLNGTIQSEDLPKINQVYGLNLSKAKAVTIPVRYIILNPADIKVGGNISFAQTTYYKSFTDYELEKLRKPRTEEDKEIVKNLPTDILQKIKVKGYGEVLLPLDTAAISAVFYKKQDYEPFSVPMGYPVLSDINWKAEMKKMDMAVMRTMNQVILLVTMGAEPEKGGINQKHIEAVQQFFQNESVARTLVADYTTKAEFKIPDIANLLDPKKYAVVDKDIREGLNNLLVNSDDKFSNASVKIEVFVERLRQARQAFIHEFLLPEIKRIAQEVGLKNYPTPYFEDIDLKDNLEYAKVYTRLAELGILTPPETLECIDNGRLPSKEESVENQKEFRALKDKGYYEPIVGGPFSQKTLQDDGFKNQQKLAEDQRVSDEKKHSKELKHKADNPGIYKQPQPIQITAPGGRPSGSKAPKKPGKVGASFSLSKIKNNIVISSQLDTEVEEALKSKFKIKELNPTQKEVAVLLANSIRVNNSPDKWLESVPKYAESPVELNLEINAEIDEIACQHQVDEFLASLLYHSKVEDAAE